MYRDQMHAYADLVKPDARLVMLDSTFIEKPARPWPRVVSAAFTRMAEEEVGTQRVANVVMLGALTYVTGLVRPETVRRVIESTVNPRWRDANLRAFEVGYRYAERNLGRVDLGLGR